jgi:hypothetical protein
MKQNPYKRPEKTHEVILGAAALAAFLTLATSCSQIQSPSSTSASELTANLSDIPLAFHGAWTSNPSGLGFEDDDGGLLVEARKIHGWEWRGDVVSVKSIGLRTIVVQSKGFAEGEPYDSELTLQLTDDGSVLLTRTDAGGGWIALYRAHGG